MTTFEQLQRTRNLRDVGDLSDNFGIKVRSGRLFRMGRLYGFTDDEIEVIKELGITDIIDLRSGSERLAQPDPHIVGIENHHIDMSAGRLGLKHVTDLYRKAAAEPGSVDAHDYILKSYQELPVQCTKEVYRTVELITSNPDGVYLIHCAGGKDRTGFLTAALLGSVGVPKEVILHDFLRSRKSAKEDEVILSRYLKRFRDSFGIEIPPEVAGPFLTVSEDAILAMMDSVNSSYGGFSNYMTKKVGISAVQAQILSDWLTE